MQHCDQTCSHCARSFWAWLKSREAQMSGTRKAKGARPAETTSFNAAMLTSVHAPAPGQPCHCEHPVGAARAYRDAPAEVVHNAGHVGGDGTHWVKVRSPVWGDVHVPCGSLTTAR